ncbi:unnamed protein product [Caenorhabditis auriculariae]|uniref:MAM domain-containing protein n=1 Tax=Caenorhabditis auriculariae TaxID=2777116 RepID=A0A8S1HHP9_9PELO|nr:unnamed protein product [Caenorhabditis auriculariae]
MIRCHLVWLLALLTQRVTSSDSVDCSFDVGECGWKFGEPWNVAAAVFVPGIFGTSRKLESFGPFLVAQGRFGGPQKGATETNWLDPNPAMRVLSFRYIKLGDAKLKVLLRKEGNVTVLDSLEGNPISIWTTRNIVVPSSNSPVQIIFLSDDVKNGHDVVAIDDVTLQHSDGVLAAGRGDLKNQWAGWQRETRRAPKSEKDRGVCSIIKCSFHGNSCSWDHSNFRVLTSKIVSEVAGESILISEPAILPMNAHFQMDLFSSEASSTTVFLRSGSEESVIWTKGDLTEQGWNRVRFPLRFSPLPSTIMIRSFSPSGGFIAISNTDIVDESGNAITCGSNTLPIRPQREDFIRLTAYQKLDQASSSSQFAAPLFTPEPTKLSSPIPRRPLPTLALARDPKPIFASLPISPSQISSAGVTALPIRPVATYSPPNLENSTNGKQSLEGKFSEIAKKFGLGQLISNGGAEKNGLHLLEALSNLRSTGIQVPPSLNQALASKISQVLAPPPGYGDDSKPFARQNMDLVVENAFRKYLNEQLT